MTNARDEGDMASVLDVFTDQMRAIAKAQQQRVRLTGTATSRDKTVQVTVNANGVVIETKFFHGIADLGYDEIARTVTATAQAAAADVARKNAELAAPLVDRRARLPKLHELIDGMPEFTTEIPLEPPVSTAPPGAAERAEDDPDTMTFTDVEVVEHERPDRGVTDTVW